MNDRKLDILAEDLFRKINSNEEFFRTKIVIVPSIKMESYLKAYYLKNNHNKVLMNVLFMTLNKALIKLFNLDLEVANIKEVRDVLIKYLNESSNNTYLDNKNASDYYIKLFNYASVLSNLINTKESDLSIDSDNNYENEYRYLKDRLYSNNKATLKMLVDYNLIIKDKIDKSYDVYLFGFISYSELEKKIIEEIDIKEEYLLDSDVIKEESPKLSIIKAPSALREIEYLHSVVCKLINNGVRYPDILVIGTNMSEYESTISRVFNQDGVNYPNISYYVNAPILKNNNIYNALLTIKEVVNKGFFSRLDFDNLITNKAIKYVRGITDEDIDSFRSSISDINAYYKEDWDYAKKRLLTSKISDINSDNNIVDLDKSYLPYARIGLDDEAIVRFIKVIDDLNDLITLFNECGNTTKEFLESFSKALDSFLSIKDENGEETNGYYKKVDLEYNFWLNNEIFDVPKRTYLEALIDASKRNITKQGNLYLSGVSFTEFDKDFIIPAKYIFLINASANNLPIKKTKNALNKDEVISYKEEKEAFNALYNNCEHLYVSYVSKDLKSDEDFFLSNFVKELDDPLISEIIEKNPRKVFDEEYLDKVSLDEDGSISEVFTRRGERNRDFRKGLLGGATESIESTVDVTKQNIEVSVRASELGKFLDEPLQSKASRLFGSSDDTMKEVVDEYPPFALNNLDRSMLLKQICKELLGGNDSKEARLTLIKSFDLRKQITTITLEIEKEVLEDLFSDYDSIKEYVSHFGDPVIFSSPSDLEITYSGESQVLREKAPLIWTLSNNTPYIVVENSDSVYYFPVKKEEDQKSKDLLTMLVIALMDGALNKYEGKEIILCPNYLFNKESQKVMGLDENTSIERLNLIYEAYVNYHDNYLFSYSYIDDTKFNKIKDSIYSLESDVRDNNETWKFYEDKKLFDFLYDLGYSEDGYKDELDSEGNVIAKGRIALVRKRQKELIDKLLGKEEDAENE